jgi:indole-3-glycerol phosphate synthase
VILDDIVRATRAATAVRQQQVPLEALKRQAAQSPVPPDFTAAIARPGLSIIAEVKKASPSRGIIRPDFEPVAIARSYAGGGAAAISVLTEEQYFLGRPEYLKEIAADLGAGRPPLLRKDFITDPYQVYEARAWGASAVLLIAGILTPERLAELLELVGRQGMAALVEAHDEGEVAAAVSAGARVIGINNRDLKTFTVDINTTGRLRPLVPADRLVVSESGIATHEDMNYLRQCGVDAALIGEALMTGTEIKHLMSGGE